MQNKKIKIEARKIENFKPRLDVEAKFVQAGRFTTMTYMDRPTIGKTYIKRLSDTHYKYLRTGEVKAYKKYDTDELREKRIKNLRAKFEELKAIIRTNFESEKLNQVFITGTYCENMKDTDQLFKDFGVFMKGLEREYPAHKFTWVVVMEPQGRGAWHFHLMLKSDQSYFSIPHNVLNRLWRVNWEKANIPPPIIGYTKRNKPRYEYKPLARRGMINITGLKSTDVGNYYSAYFTHCIAGSRHEQEEIEFLGETLGEDDTGQSVQEIEQEMSGDPVEMRKSLVKGQRMHFYPKHFKIYRCSFTVERPKKFHAYLGDQRMEKDLGGMRQQEVKSFEVIRVTETDFGDGSEKKAEIEVLNTVYKVTYNANTRGEYEINRQKEPEPGQEEGMLVPVSVMRQLQLQEFINGGGLDV